MALLKMSEEVGEKYSRFIDAYRDKTGQNPKAAERVEAYFCAMSKDPWERPYWVK